MSRRAGPGGDAGRPSLRRLNPELASPPPAPPSPPSDPEPGPDPGRAIDTRPYRWVVGIIALVAIVGIGVYQFVTHGVRSSGVPPGHRLHLFAAPLAASTLNGDPNPHPECTLAHHDPRALNLCLMAARGPVVLSFFVPGARQCERQVDALQTLAGRFSGVQFAAVAVGAGHAQTAAIVGRRHWTIPVAYDRDGTVQSLYDVVACPMVEMARRGGVVRSRLIGDRWQSPAALEPYVRALAPGGGGGPG